MNKKKILNLLTTLFIGFSLGWIGSTWRFGGDGFRGDGDHRRPPHPSEQFAKLGVSPDTLNQLESIHHAGRREHEELRYEIEMSKREFDKLSETSKNEAQITEAFENFIQKRNELERVRLKTMLKVHSLLTPEQIRKLRSMGPPPGEHRGPPPRR